MILADGTRFDGYLTGAAARPDWRGPAWGEVVFNTSMTGYQEVITDPSYAGQVVVMTYPQIGNYGVTADDSEKPVTAARALVVHDLQEFFSPGPGRVSLESFMMAQDLPGMTGVDTRAVTKHVRDKGAVVAAIGRTLEEARSLGASSRDRVRNSQRGARGGTGSRRGHRPRRQEEHRR
jgi:carbamoyl-phosphate synthase small subunit